MPEEPQNGNTEQVTGDGAQDLPVEPPKTPVYADQPIPAKKYTFRFEISVTKEQAAALGNYCKEQGITLTRIQ
jgi:hypothetical protein